MIKYAFRSNINLNLTKSTELYLKLSASFDDYNGPIDGGTEVYRMAMQANPVLFQPYYEADEQYSNVRHILYGNYGDGNYVNPYAQVQRGYREYSKNTMLAQLGFKQKLDMVTEGLSARAFVNIDRYAEFSAKREWTPFYYGISSYKLLDGSYTLKRLKGGSDGLNYSSGDRYINTAFYLEAALEYSRQFNEKHNVNGLFVYTMRESKHSNPHITNLQLSLPNRNIGFAGRMAYNYDYRYMVELNFGYNGSENFAKGHRFGFFPSVALGWLMSEEPWMEPLKNTFDKIKFRASMGQAGNDNIGGRRFAYLTTLKTDASGYTWGTTGQKNYDKGITEGEIGVTNLTWETATKSNLGLEVGLWNALDITVDVFREKRKNIFMQRRIIPTQTGFITNPWANYGKVTNGGMEVSINLHKQLNKDWFTSFYGNFTFAKNRVDEYDEAPSKIGTYRGQTGRSMNELWGLTAERLFTADDFESDGSLKFGIPKQEVGADKLYPGDIKYVDMNGDGKITEEDEGYIGGTEDPRIVYGFGGVIAYKNIDFNFFFQGTADAHRVIGNSTIFLPGSGTTVQGNAYSENLDDRWTDDNQDPYAFWPRLTYGPNKNNYRASTWWKKDMSFLRLKTVEIGYTFPKKWMEKIYSKGARVFVSGNNLLCFSPFKLWDPELGTNNGLKYPMNRSILFGIDINF